MKKLLIAICLLMILIGGCMSTREKMTKAGHKPDFIDGWVDGESSGLVSAGHPYYKFKKDYNKYETNKDYRRAWDDSFRMNKGQYEALQRMTP